MKRQFKRSRLYLLAAIAQLEERNPSIKWIHRLKSREQNSVAVVFFMNYSE